MGRRPQFDRSEVLTKALDLFWERGYHAVSVSDLVEATGLLPGSLYASFGNKEGIFIAALEHYAAQTAELRNEVFKAESPLQVVRNFLSTMIERAIDPCCRRGCFLVNTSLECGPDDAAIKTALRDCMQRGESWLADQIAAAMTTGELRSDTDAKALAASLMSAVFGLQILSRTGEAEQKIRSVGESSFESLLAPWQQVSAVV